jgi:hypothetical protein
MSQAQNATKHTKCEINNFSVTCMHATCAISAPKFSDDFLQVIRWWFSHWLRLKIGCGHQEGRGGVHLFVSRPLVAPLADLGWIPNIPSAAVKLFDIIATYTGTNCSRLDGCIESRILIFFTGVVPEILGGWAVSRWLKQHKVSTNPSKVYILGVEH